MSIQVVCPNGHELSVKDSCAGKIGLCPACKAKIKVPEAVCNCLSEDDIMDILGPEPNKTAVQMPTRRDSGNSEDEIRARLDRESAAMPKKACHVCHKEIAVTNHICPHCHTYIAKLGDF